MYLHAVQTFSGTPEEIFPFFADARNLERLTPAFLRFRILSETPIEMRDGATIDYALRLNGLPIRWRSEILEWHPGKKFIDQQIRGPYRKWFHEHIFVGMGSHTEVHDRIEYQVPGPALMERRFVRPQLERIFQYRAEVLRWYFREAAPARLEFGEDRPVIAPKSALSVEIA